GPVGTGGRRVGADGITLAAVEARRDVEVQRQLIQTVDVELPLGVQEHAVLGSAARRTNRDDGAILASRRCVVRLRISGVGGLTWYPVGRVDAGVRSHMLFVVVPGEAAAHHPLVGETP